MKVQLLNLISTPVPVLNSLGLDLSIGLSSEDPTQKETASETHMAYVTLYGPQGQRLDRRSLGEIPPRRRRMFSLSKLTREYVGLEDHLLVIHRVPKRLVKHADLLDEPVDLEHAPEYPMWRGLIEYSYPGGGNGSVIYETPPRLNVRKPGAPPSTTLTFSSKIVLSDIVRTYVVPIHYSMDPAYHATCHYHYMVYNGAGEQVLANTVVVPPFSIKVLDLASELSADVLRKATDPNDKMANFSFVAYSDDAALAPLILNLTPSVGGVSVEHTHPAQSFLLPSNMQDKNRYKGEAIAAWKTIFEKAEQSHVG